MNRKWRGRAASQVPYPHSSISAGGDDAMTVGAEGCVQYPVSVPEDWIWNERLMVMGKPDARGMIEASRYNEAAIRTEFRAVDYIDMIQIRQNGPPRSNVPNTRFAIKACRNERPSVWTECDVSDPRRMFEWRADLMAVLSI